MPLNTRTKILATLGPSSNSELKIEELIDAGVDGFRLNFSHGTHEEHKIMYDRIRKVSKAKGTHTAIVADLQGPKLRIGKFKDGKVLLNKGQKFSFDMKKDLGDETRVTLPHKEIFEALKVGDKLLVNDGNIILKVIKCNKESAVTEVEVGGFISGHKGVNLPNSSLKISPLTEKDLKDLDLLLNLGWIVFVFLLCKEQVMWLRLKRLSVKKLGLSLNLKNLKYWMSWMKLLWNPIW